MRGHDENLATSDNPGNFLALLQLLAKYDPVAESHLRRVSENPRSVSYLSHESQNEFINNLGKKLRDIILSEIIAAKYFGILFDSTPDVSHKDQASQVIRYVKLDYDSGNVEIHESFIDFIVLEKKTLPVSKKQYLKNSIEMA